jgi:hypothetical protein
MSNKLYSIIGVNTEENLENKKLEIMQSLKQAKVGSVADNAIFFSYGATGFIDVFPDHNEIRAEVQADDEDAKTQAQATMQEHLFSVLNIEEGTVETAWRDITDAVLSDQARVAAEKARNAATTEG